MGINALHTKPKSIYAIVLFVLFERFSIASDAAQLNVQSSEYCIPEQIQFIHFR